MGTKKILTSKLHPKNKHNSKYNFLELIDAYPLLKEFVFVNQYETETIDFANPEAVKAINTALLVPESGVKPCTFSAEL